MSALMACHPRMVPTITAGEYNAQRNQTDYIVMPYGSVSLPGKWIHGRYRQESRQQYFSNSDSSIVSIAFGQCNKLGFSTGGAVGYDFVKLYYKWENKYQTEILNQHVKLIASDSANKYMVWQVYGDNMNQFFLAGAHDCACGECAFQNYSIVSSKLTDEQKAKFLQDIYLEKNSH
jgi:hypothetical protein